MNGKQNDREKTPISSLGKNGLIQKLGSGFVPKRSQTVKGPGDDAAVMDYKGYQTVMSTDMLLEGIHFNLVYTPLMHLGYKAVVANLSDIYAMNALPVHILVSLGLSGKFGVEDVESLYEGIRAACERYETDLAGGDLCSSITGLALSVTAAGITLPGQTVYRSGAKKGDLICVSGELGGAYLGLQVLERENRLFMEDPAIQPKLEGYDYVLQRQLRPEARNDVVALFREREVIPHSMIDLSAGLNEDLLKLCEASGVGCRLYADRIPVHPDARKIAEEFSMAAETAAMNGGEDYELLFCLPGKAYDRISDFPGITAIGEIQENKEGKWLVSSSGKKNPLYAKGMKA